MALSTLGSIGLLPSFTQPLVLYRVCSVTLLLAELRAAISVKLRPHPFRRFVNHARNVWDRAVTLLPRVDQLWYKYIHMEEMLGNVPAARQIFERWMQWEPDHHGWAAYVKVTSCTVPWLRSQ